LEVVIIFTQSQRLKAHPCARRARRRGAALVEFAFVAVLLLFMLLGLLQFGIYLSTTNTLWNLSREGARYASINPSDDDNIRDHIESVSPTSINGDKLSISISPVAAENRTGGSEVTVQLTYDMSDHLVFSLPQSFFGRELGNSYTTYTTMMVENSGGGLSQ
jgi:Flp pilus assembly protein TadG